MYLSNVIFFNIDLKKQYKNWMIWVFWMPYGKKIFVLHFSIFSLNHLALFCKRKPKSKLFQVSVTGKLFFSCSSGFLPCFCQNFLCHHYIHQEIYPCPNLSVCKRRIETLVSLLVKFSRIWKCFRNLEGRWNSCRNDMFSIYINSEIYPIWLGWQCQKPSSKGNTNNCHW